MSWPALGAVFERPRARIAALAYALAMVGLDYWLVRHGGSYFPRLALGLVALVVASHLAMRDPRGPDSLGWRRLTAAERRWWARVVGLAAVVVVVAIAGCAIAARARGAPLWPLDAYQTSLELATWSVLVWPLYEEVIYRLTLVPAAVAAVGRPAAFVLSAAAFTYLHQLYGNLAPTHPFGAIVMTLAFLRTGSLALSIGLHAGGNLAVVVANQAMHHAVTSSGG